MPLQQKERLTGKGRRFAKRAAVTAGLTAAFGAAIIYLPSFLIGGDNNAQQNDTAPASAEPAKQEAASVYQNEDGRKYWLWEGYIVEESDNNVLSEVVDFDANVYDFDLGLILHTAHTRGGMEKTYFNDLADADGKLPPHIDKVRRVGCDIADYYFERQTNGTHGEPPADVKAYRQAHCPNTEPGTEPNTEKAAGPHPN